MSDRGRRWWRKARDSAEGNVDMSGSEHDWWARRESATAPTATATDRPGAPSGPDLDDRATRFPTATFRARAGQAAPAAERASAAGPTAPPAVLAEPEIDPYVVLGVDERSTWDDITAAHRRLAKAHHPDRLGEATAADRERAEARIRQLNVAYSQLRLRRGK